MQEIQPTLCISTQEPVLINETLPQSIRTEGHVLVPYLAQLRLGEEGRLLHGKLGNSHLNTFQTSHIHPDPFRSL